MILVLGGTRDAHEIAMGLENAGIHFVVSMAGVTKDVVERLYPVRTGGFGGVDGLIEYLGKREITGVIDATHPFAEVMSVSAAGAAQACGLPLIRFERPKWEPADWVSVKDLAAAAQGLPEGARAFLTVGANSLAPFACRDDVWFLFRGIEAAEMPFAQGEALVQRPPFHLEGEVTLMRDHRITHLVSKNAGGRQTVAKLYAAKQLGIEVIMVERPVLPVVESSSTVLDILRWARRVNSMQGET